MFEFPYSVEWDQVARDSSGRRANQLEKRHHVGRQENDGRQHNGVEHVPIPFPARFSNDPSRCLTCGRRIESNIGLYRQEGVLYFDASGWGRSSALARRSGPLTLALGLF